MNSTPFKIAARYLFSKKTRNVINLISGISLVVVACVTATMIILLSAFNGIEELVDGLYNKFDPDITISSNEGKVLFDDSLDLATIAKINGVLYISSVIEETAIISKGDSNKSLCKLIGIDTTYVKLSGIKENVVYGTYSLHEAGENFVIPGAGIAGDLGLQLRNGESENLRIYAPIRGKKISISQKKALRDELVSTSGAFSINAEMDVKYVVSTLSFARRMFDYKDQSSYIGIEVLDENDSDEIRDEIKMLIGKDFLVKTRREKNPLVYETNATEKKAVFLILVFVLIIAVFNGMASLTMLVLEKQRDVSVLKSMGATWPFIKRIFILEGALINIIGAAVGTVLGLSLCLAQQKFGLLRLHGTVVDFYPIKIDGVDITVVISTVVFIGVIATYFMVNYLVKKLKETSAV
ncbi:MAG: FtsX-like permease family protein [Flavobacteriales bacterium]